MSNNRARKQAKKIAGEPLTELEKAIRAIDEATESANSSKQRKPCYCLATKHKLNVFAPNCLNCGKIICALEGPGPCTYCGKPVVSVDQQQAMVLELKREKAALAKQQAMANAKRKPKASAVSTSGYATKLGGGMSSVTGAAGGWLGLNEDESAIVTEGMTEEEELAEATKASLAQAHKDRLLEYDRTSARRSHVIDQATDFVLPGDRPNLWLTDEERAAQAEKAKKNLERASQAVSGYQRAKVMTIDVSSRRVIVEASNYQTNPEDEDDDSVPEPIDKLEMAKKNTSISGGNKHGGGGGIYAQNPLLKIGETPTFLKRPDAKGSKKATKEKILATKAEAVGNKEAKTHKAKVSRLQYDGPDAFLEDAIFSSSSGIDAQLAIASIKEPKCG